MTDNSTLTDVSKRRWLIVVRTIEVVFVIVICSFAFMRLGNPQWHKYIYIFQNYVSPGKYTRIPPSFSGIWKAWNFNGQVRTERNYVNGKWDGKCTYWYSNGQKKSEGNYGGGIRHRDGKWTYWYSNGQKKSEKNYADGKRNGKWIWWSRDGQTTIEGIYKDGSPWEGKFPTYGDRWYLDSKVTDFKDGKKVGRTR